MEDQADKAKLKLDEAKVKFTAIMEDGSISEGRMLKILVKILMTQVPYGRLITVLIDTVKESYKKKNPADIIFDVIVNYVGSYVDDVSDIAAIFGKINEKASEEKNRLKAKLF